jgi:hypothetical protein
VATGVVWNRGKVFLHDRLLYADLLPETGHKYRLLNLQQYHLSNS